MSKRDAPFSRRRPRLLLVPLGYMLLGDSLYSGDSEFYFSDQKELGLGIRVCTPISVQRGGTMLDSEGHQNEKGICGKATDWCDYSGPVDGETIGITVMCHPENFRPFLMHSRDYFFGLPIRLAVAILAKGNNAK